MSILLNSVLTKAKGNYPASLSDDEVFEFYCADNILINYDLDHAEIESGVIDGPRDAGIDAAYIFVNTQLLTDDLDLAPFGNLLSWNCVSSRQRIRTRSRKALLTSWRHRCRCCSTMRRNLKISNRSSKKKWLQRVTRF